MGAGKQVEDGELHGAPAILCADDASVK